MTRPSLLRLLGVCIVAYVVLTLGGDYVKKRWDQRTGGRREVEETKVNSSVPEGAIKRLVVLGESMVQGGRWLTKTEDRWPDVLWRLLETAQEAPIAYHNAGVGASVISPQSPGYAASTKPSAAERLDTEVIASNPDLVVIAYGLNDMRAGMPVETFRAEMVDIIRRLRRAGDPLIVIANVYHMSAYDQYPPFDRGSLEATKQYNQMLRELCAEMRCVYADVWAAEAQKDYVVDRDTVHANKIGNMLIAHKVFEAIVHALPDIAPDVRERDARTEKNARVQ